jgi:hypothetical protein
MKDIIFVHGMFQNPKSWTKWVDYFSRKGYTASHRHGQNTQANPPNSGPIRLKDWAN